MQTSPNEKAQAPGRTGGVLSHLLPRLLRAWADLVQTGACIVRQAQDWTGPEYIRPGTVSSTLAVTPAALEVHNTVRWGKPDIRIDIKFASGSG